VLKKFFIPCKAKVSEQVGPPFFADLQAVISGPEEKKIDPVPFVNFAIPILSVPTGPSEINSQLPKNLLNRLRRYSLLIDALHQQNFEIAIETNGTIAAPAGIDWICVSPKAGADWIQKTGHELKLVYPQPLLMPNKLDTTGFENCLLQPMDGLFQKKNTAKAIEYCQNNPEWRLSVQTHKFLEIR
jgi:hypothetical protein